MLREADSRDLAHTLLLMEPDPSWKGGPDRADTQETPRDWGTHTRFLARFFLFAEHNWN